MQHAHTCDMLTLQQGEGVRSMRTHGRRFATVLSARLYYVGLLLGLSVAGLAWLRPAGSMGASAAPLPPWIVIMHIHHMRA